MAFRDILKDSFKAALRNPGDVGGTLADFKHRQNRRKADASREQMLGVVARRAYERASAKEHQGPWEEQYQDEDVKVIVRSGFSQRDQRVTTEVLIFLRRNNSDRVHYHLALDEYGNEIYSGINPDAR